MKRAAALVLGVALSAGPGSPAEPVPTFDDVMLYLHFDAGERARVLKGVIVGKDFRENDEKEISIAVAVLLAVPLAKLAEEIRNGELLRADQEVIDFRLIAPGAALDEAFKAVGYSAGEGREARRLLASEPGSAFNLGATELERLGSLRARYAGADCEREPGCIDAVSVTYRGILRERLESYQKDGLAGIAAYERGSGTSVRPGDELRHAAEDAELIRRAFPEFYKAFTEFPKSQLDRYDNQFLWIKRRVQGRPAFALAHRLYDRRPDMALIVERQFYAGTSYNSLQTIIGLLPQGSQTLLVYTNRTFSDQVAGAGSGLRHALGRKSLMNAVLRILESLRQRLR